MTDPPTSAAAIALPGPWLVRIGEVFGPWLPELLATTGARSAKPLGGGFHLLDEVSGERLNDPMPGRFIRWRLPLHHVWPCQPAHMPDFIEKAAREISRKFAPAHPQMLLTGPLDPGSPDPTFKRLATNLRGRTMQLLPPPAAATADAQDPAEPSLFCLVGKPGLFCGMASPRACGGFHPGGSRFIRQKGGATLSRAGAKVAEALHHFRLYRPLPQTGAHWLDLGASPGGITAELLGKGYRVTALDRAPLDPRLNRAPGCRFVRADIREWSPPSGTLFDALACDLNGDPRDAMRQVARLARTLAPDAWILFTFKTAGEENPVEIAALAETTRAVAAAAGLALVAETHLTYNRKEFTWLLEPRSPNRSLAPHAHQPRRSNFFPDQGSSREVENQTGDKSARQAP